MTMKSGGGNVRAWSSWRSISVFITFLLSISSGVQSNDDKPLVNQMGQPAYGADISFPMQHPVSTNYPDNPHDENSPFQILGDKQKFYEEYLQGCRDMYSKGKKGKICDVTEEQRLEMSLRQPSSMVNYTDIGFKKIKAPKAVFRLVEKFWENNKDQVENEVWGKGNSYVNHWNTPTGFVSVENSGLRGGGFTLKQRIWEAAKDTLEEWTGQELTACSLYGIRIYYDGAVLAPHVDRLPLVSSAIINVAQDVDEPWPIEVIGHDGLAYNVTMEPGEMVLYESHSVLHGRPFPLKGRYFANIFVHFEPVGHSLRHHGLELGGLETDQDREEQYKRDASQGLSGHEHHRSIPSYLIPDSEESRRFKATHPNGWEPSNIINSSTGSTAAHIAAQEADLETLKDIAEVSPHALHKKDRNGWHPIHEASRFGHLEVVKFLIENGADVNERTSHGRGHSPLSLVEENNGADHPLAEFLRELGALKIGPDL